MKYDKFIKKLLPALLFPVLAMTSCYDGYIEDHEVTIAYFSTQKPLRTVVAGRDMKIKVGVSLGGKRAVDVNDWAEFEIDPSLLAGTGFTLLPKRYYNLANPNTFRVSNGNLAIADVEITFTDEFYADVKAVDTYYALPFRVTGSSLDSINTGAFDPKGNELLPAKDYSIVAVKYISAYHGTYYVKGKLDELNDAGVAVKTTTYSDADLSRNITRNVFTVSATEVQRPGLANFVVADNEAVKITVQANDHADKVYPLVVEAPSGCTALSEASGTYYGNKERPEIVLKYKFEKGGKTYRVEETLVLRQDPVNDLRFEEW